ncbi:hypothetical protein FE772_10450 [Lysobacter enzymogenes]|nr:hypothetical protein FE772_10450 [Lysobacter enzymogenes]
MLQVPRRCSPLSPPPPCSPLASARPRRLPPPRHPSPPPLRRPRPSPLQRPPRPIRPRCKPRSKRR